MTRTGDIMSSEQTYSFFFYGTLMVPPILQRVIKHQGSGLSFNDAILPGYTRHCIKGEDYPAVIDAAQSAELVQNGNLNEKDLEVRGTLVKGLSAKDVKVIDIFEASEYKRVKIPVKVLGPSTVLKNGAKPQTNGAQETEEAWVYVWNEPLSGLEPKIWSFEDFMRDKAHLWADPKQSWYMDEVDEYHKGSNQPDAKTVSIAGQKVEGFPDFGHNMLQYWRFAKGLTYMNNGSYGATPSPVIEATRRLHDQIESFPDLFMRKSWLPLLNACRQQVADIINAKYDECIIVKNASTAINTVVNNIKWQDGDVIVIYETTYNAMMQTMKRVCDEHPKITLEIINNDQPCPHATVLKKTEDLLARYNEVVGSETSLDVKPRDKKPGQRVKFLVIDSIASNPGVVMPWEQVVGLCHKYGVFSMVDGAHSIGQHKVDVERSKPDFLTSCCHKWLMSHRGSAVFYVPLRNQHLIRASVPTSSGYESSRYPTQGVEREWEFAKQWEWNGTQDWAPLMSITPAIEFRKSIGGEERIMGYCHDLAVKGGQRLSQRWGTPVMDNANPEDGVLTACMINIAVPDIPEPKDAEERFEMNKYFERFFFGGDVYVPLYKHNGRTWGRFSCQVWNELVDFDVTAEVLERMIEGIKRGEHRNIKVSPTDTLHDVEDVPLQEDLKA